MRLLVCGGRDFNDYEFVKSVLDPMKKDITVIIHGAASGADFLAGRWAYDNNIPVEAFPADWEKYGKKAGFLRNQSMIDEGNPDAVVAFPGGNGTRDMIKRAEKAKLPTFEITL